MDQSLLFYLMVVSDGKRFSAIVQCDSIERALVLWLHRHTFKEVTLMQAKPLSLSNLRDSGEWIEELVDADSDS